MVDLPALLRRGRDDLRDLGIEHALVGGMAVSVRTEPRFTRDVDLVVVVAGDDEAEALVRTLAGRGWRAVETVEQDVVQRFATARLTTGGHGAEPVVDLLFASSGIEADIVERAEFLEVLPGLELPVATTADLVVLKLLAVDEDRPQDEQDLRALLADLDAHGIARARQAAEDVMTRGYARNRDLVTALDERVRFD